MSQPPDDPAAPAFGLAFARLGSDPGIELLALGIIAVTYAALVTHGSFDLIGEEWLGSNFDHLGKSLLRLEAEVPTNTETLRADGKDTIYFGPLPALVRILLNGLWPAGFGQWSRVSCLVAALLAALAWIRSVRLATAAAPLARGQQLLIHLAFGLGTPVAFLVSCAYIYHEAMLWALCCSLWAQHWLLALILSDSPPRWHWLAYSTLAGLTFLARVPFGVPHVLVTGLLLVNAAAGERIAARLPALRALLPAALARSLRSGAAVACLVLPLLTGVAGYAWYNFERFGNALTFHDYSKVLIYLEQPDLYRRHLEIGTFNPRRIPTNLSNYFGLSGTIDSNPPWVHFQHSQGMGDDLYLSGYREWSFSLTKSSAWLVAGGGIALLWLLSRARLFELAIAACFLSQFAVSLTYYWVSHRMASEFLPGLCMLFLLLLVHRREIDWLRWRTLRSDVLTVLLISSIPLTLLGTLSWNAEYNWAAPVEYREALARIFEAMRPGGGGR